MKRIVVLLLTLSLLLLFTGCGLFDREVAILVCLDDDLTDIESRAMATKISAFESAIEVEYKSGEEALAEFINQLEDPSAMEGIATDILPDQCIVIALETDSDELIRQICQLDGVVSAEVVSSSRTEEAIQDMFW